MLRKIIKVRNVGKLQEVRAAGDVELRPVNLDLGRERPG